jgi:hypothetical protein
MEYNKIWKNLLPDQREYLISSTNDDYGPNYADRYMDEDDWNKIPDSITNSITNLIDLREYGLFKSQPHHSWLKKTVTENIKKALFRRG